MTAPAIGLTPSGSEHGADHLPARAPAIGGGSWAAACSRCAIWRFVVGLTPRAFASMSRSVCWRIVSASVGGRLWALTAPAVTAMVASAIMATSIHRATIHIPLHKPGLRREAGTILAGVLGQRRRAGRPSQHNRRDEQEGHPAHDPTNSFGTS